MTYKQQVKAAAAALTRGEDANWELARLTYENTLNNNERNAAKVTMAEWCADVVAASGRKFSRSTGQSYKAVWTRFRAQHARHEISWSEALASVNPSRFDDLSQRTIAKASPEVKRETFLALADDADVAAHRATGEIAVGRLIRSDPEVARHAQKTLDVRWSADRHNTVKADPHEPRPERDYDMLVESYANGLAVVLAAESSGRWTPSEQSEALLYFLTQILGNRREPTGAHAELVQEKLARLVDDVEAYANGKAF